MGVFLKKTRPFSISSRIGNSRIKFAIKLAFKELRYLKVGEESKVAAGSKVGKLLKVII